MCGLVGIFAFGGKPVANAEMRIRRMTEMLRHRGPDAEGIWVSPDGLCALGNTRLAITDPEAPIELPARSRDGSAVLTFNGEIYDYQEQRAALEARGIAFRYRTDTEVLLEGLRLDGEKFLDRLDGMWAFGYYDIDQRKLLLGRDIMGERHVFYWIRDGELIFASEPLPILADGEATTEIDFDAVVCALLYHAPPPGRTLVRGLKRMRPGHLLRAASGEAPSEVRCQRLHPERWFDFFQSEPSEDAVIEAFESNLRSSSLRRLPPDVPFISTLSGGLDSTLICVFASEFGQRKIRTLFGQSADEPARNRKDELDEYAASLVTSGKLGTEHVHIMMNNDDSIPVLRDLSRNSFDGLLDSGVAPFGMLARQVRRDATKVMLISDGPDELAGGYPTDQRAAQLDACRDTQPLRYGLMSALSASRFSRRVLRRLGANDWVVPPEHSYAPFHFEPRHQLASHDYLCRLLTSSQMASVWNCYGADDAAYADILPALDWTQRHALSYAAFSLPDMFNLRTDKGFLAVAVECRLPFQAPGMAEFMIALPGRWRFGPKLDTTKYLMRRIVERRIGSEVAWRSKHGFSAPLYGTPKVRDALAFEDTLRATSLFRDLPFKPGTESLVLDSRFRKFRWPFFALAHTYERMRKADYR